MARTPRRLARGSSAEVAAYTGPAGEPIWNATTGRLHLQDGASAGGKPHALLGDLVPLTGDIGDLETAVAALTALIAAQVGGALPQGRLTLQSGVSVMSAAVAAGTTIYYTPHVGRIVPLWDGTKLVGVDIGGELSQALSDATKSPAAAVANTNYDKFVWDDAGTKRCTRGPAWSSAIDPGTGPGTTEIEQVAGVWVNKYAITNGPAARRGLFVGSIRTNAAALIDWSLGSGAAGGGIANMTVWNAYNQVEHQICVRDTTASWVYNTAVARAMNGSNSNRINLLAGRGVGPVAAGLGCRIVSSGNFGSIYIGLDSTTVQAVGSRRVTVVSYDNSPLSEYRGNVGLGFHFLQAIEVSGGATQTYYGGGTDQAFSATWAC